MEIDGGVAPSRVVIMVMVVMMVMVVLMVMVVMVVSRS